MFDTGPLSHFARARWLNVLKIVRGDKRAVIPEAVVTELKIGAHSDHRRLAAQRCDRNARRALEFEVAAPVEIEGQHLAQGSRRSEKRPGRSARLRFDGARCVGHMPAPGLFVPSFVCSMLSAERTGVFGAASLLLC